MRVLFVCTGNICRSPMAEAIAAAMAGDAGIRFSSAGLHAVSGAPASRHAISAARVMGGDASGHVARGLDATMVADADLIYVMTAEQLAALRRRHPAAAAVTHLLDPTGAEVSDPYGADAGTYLGVAGQIAAAVEERMPLWAAAAGREGERPPDGGDVQPAS